MARHQAVVLPGKPGQVVCCDDAAALNELFEKLAAGMQVTSLSFYCAAGCGIGKMLIPVVRRYEDRFEVSDELTCKPGVTVKFRRFRDGHVPKHQELTTISGVRVTF